MLGLAPPPSSSELPGRGSPVGLNEEIPPAEEEGREAEGPALHPGPSQEVSYVKAYNDVNETCNVAEKGGEDGEDVGQAPGRKTNKQKKLVRKLYSATSLMLTQGCISLKIFIISWNLLGLCRISGF